LERRRRTELLSLEQERRRGAEQHDRHDRAVPARRRTEPDAHTAAGVGQLIVILHEVQERVPRNARRGRAPALVLPLVTLALVEEAALDGGYELLRGAEVVGVVRLAAARERHDSGVVEVVVPQGVQTVAAVLERQDEPHLLRLVLANENHSS